MTIPEQIEDLLKRLPSETSSEQVAAAIRRSESAIRITGALLGKQDDTIMLHAGDVRLSIKTADIISIQESASIPEASERIIYIDVAVASDADIIESRRRLARELGSHMGKRPFVHEIPSAASDYAVSAADFEARQAIWRSQVGLARTRVPLDTPTPSLSSGPTVNQTAVDTSSQTGTPNDSQTDHSTDFNTDQQTDYTSDYNSDPDPQRVAALPLGGHMTSRFTAVQTGQNTGTPDDTITDNTTDHVSDDVWDAN